MSFLDGLFVVTEEAPSDLLIAEDPIVASASIEPGFLYQLEGSDSDIALEVIGHTISTIVGKRIGLKVIAAAPNPPGGLLSVSVPAGMLIEDDDGNLTNQTFVGDDQALGNYREWILDADGNWLLVAGAASSGPAEPLAHAPSHQAGGLDEIDVTGLSGVLADPQTPATHASMHEDGGAGEISVAGLSGRLAGAQLIAVAKAGSLVGTRGRLNLHDGTGALITVTDDAGNDEIDVTFAIAPVFDPDIEIDPLHWWRASDVTQSGGLVDSLNDLGSSPKNLAQTGAARAPLGTDGNGKDYLDLTSADSYVAGVAADWPFLSNGEPFTIALVYHRTTLLTATETLLQTGAGLSANTGISVSLNFSTAALQGPVCWVQRAVGGASAIGVSHSVPSTAMETLVIRNNGSAQTAIIVNGFTNAAADMTMRRKGREVARSPRTALHSIANPANALTLAGTVRIYEVVVDNKPWSDRQVLGWEDYARGRYLVPGL